MLDALTPYLLMIKVALVAALLGLTFYGGYRSGVDVTEPKVEAVKLQMAQLQTQWAEEKAKMNADALQAAVLKNQQDTAALQAVIAKQQTEFNKRIKEIQDAQTAANTIATTTGLWVDSPECSTVPGGSNSNSALPNASGGKPATVQWCRISNATAEHLIQLATDADQVVAQYNNCVDTVNTLTKVTPESK